MLFFSFLLLFCGLQNAALEEVSSRSWESDVAMATYSEFSQNPAVKEPESSSFDTDPDSLTYTATKSKVRLLRIRLRNDLRDNRIDIDSVKRTFGDQLTNQIIPHWYGTSWSFGGYTSVPKKGKIACGYFVSTTLKDMGLNVNRYRLAQKSPIDEAKAISCGAEITTISHEDPEQALVKIKDHIKIGVYFIGFDTGHVGFLVKKKDALFLVHSNYLSPVSVCIEPLASAKVFKTFTKFHLVDISHNEKLIQKWLNDDVVL